MTVERVLLCVDDATRRSLYAAALGRVGDLELLAATPADESGVRATAARQPDVVLVEASRPWLEGGMLVARLRAVAPRARLVALAAVQDRPRTLAARALVADRYVDPGESVSAVVELLRDQGRRHDGARATS